MIRIRASISPFLLRIVFLLALPVCFTFTAYAEIVEPVLEFPEQGMDDPARYSNYATRFFRDSKKNSFQIYIDQNSGRVVNLWADSANASTSFTVRDSADKPAPVKWGSKEADVRSDKNTRIVEYKLIFDSPTIQIGHFLLGTMRKERDFQYFKKHLLPYNSEPFHEDELKKLISNLDRLPAGVRTAHLQSLNAKATQELTARLDPESSFAKTGKGWTALFKQVTFDGKNHLFVEFAVDANTTLDLTKGKLLARSITNSAPVEITVKVGTDAEALTPLNRSEIFNSEFNQFFDSVQKSNDTTRYKWLDREVRGLELLSSQEKLMAGLPNFATYFGRDTMMSSLMMEPIWSGGMLEHAIGSVLNKISERGEVSHEEALGGQAIRENADQYNKLIDEYFQQSRPELLTKAQSILQNLQAVRENYRMIDDDFQLPVLIAKYFKRADVSHEQKKSFLNRMSRSNQQYLKLLIRNFYYVAERTAPYVKANEAVNLVSFPNENGTWGSTSWRDSQAGYGGGRFAMDVNAVWVPQALGSISEIFSEFRKLGISINQYEKEIPELRNSVIANYFQSPETLQNAVKVWSGAVKHFEVNLPREEALKSIQSKLSSLPENERAFWNKILQKTDLKSGLYFLALSLDETGKPLLIVNSDPATWLFLENVSEKISSNIADSTSAIKPINVFLTPYPAGLFVEGLGPLAANDAYASPQIWETFEKDAYHSPRVVWGREVNLFILALLKEIRVASGKNDAALQPYLGRLREFLSTTLSAVEASGLKHNELWTYKIEGEKLLPVRYATSTDIQLWNLTDLSVQFLLSKERND